MSAGDALAAESGPRHVAAAVAARDVQEETRGVHRAHDVPVVVLALVVFSVGLGAFPGRDGADEPLGTEPQ